MTSVLMIAALAYWGVCAALFVGMLLLRVGDDESLKRKRELIRRAPSPRREFALVGAFLLMLLAAPVLTPFILIRCSAEFRREKALWRWVKRTYREKVFQKVHPVHLPTIARRYFEDHASDFLDLGFREIGRYVLKPEPARSYGYCFQSPDGRTLGVLGSSFDDTYFSFSTLFANGLALDTASIEESPRLARVNESKTFRAAFAPGMSVAEAYLCHEDEIERIETSFGTHALEFRPEQFRDILTYEDRVFGQWLYESGELDAPPPPAILPEQTSDDFVGVS